MPPGFQIVGPCVGNLRPCFGLEFFNLHPSQEHGSMKALYTVLMGRLPRSFRAESAG
jgi:hypothetical protein